MYTKKYGVNGSSNITSPQNSSFIQSKSSNTQSLPVLEKLSYHNKTSNNAETTKSESSQIKLIGYNGDPEFHKMKDAIQLLNYSTQNQINIQIKQNDYQADYDYVTDNLKRSSLNFFIQLKNAKSRAKAYKRPPYILLKNTDQPIFNLEQIPNKIGNHVVHPSEIQDIISSQTVPSTPDTYLRESENHMKKIFSENSKQSFAFLDISVGNDEPFKIVIELQTDTAPKTCQNFLSLCEGFQKQSSSGSDSLLSYQNSNIQRISQHGFLQAGDLSQDNLGGQSIYGKYFEDQTFDIKHDLPGIVGMTNSGKPHSNGSQFYITFKKLSFFDQQSVAFGRVVQNFQLLERLSDFPTNGETPIYPIKIVDCGAYSFKLNDLAIKSIPRYLNHRQYQLEPIINTTPQIVISKPAVETEAEIVPLAGERKKFDRDARVREKNAPQNRQSPTSGGRGGASSTTVLGTFQQTVGALPQPVDKRNSTRRSTIAIVPMASRRTPDQRFDHIIRSDLFKSINLAKHITSQQNFSTFVQNQLKKPEHGSEKYDLIYICEVLEICIKKTTLFLQTEVSKFTQFSDLLESIQNIWENELLQCEKVAMVYSTRTERTFFLQNDKVSKYVLVINPIDVYDFHDLMDCGSLFLILNKTTTGFRGFNEQDLVKSFNIVQGAGFVTYGSSTSMIFTFESLQLIEFVLDQSSGNFFVNTPNFKGSLKRGLLTLNQGDVEKFDPKISEYLTLRKNQGYYCRNNGSLISDAQRVLTYGGIAVYPQYKPDFEVDEIGKRSGVNFFDAYTIAIIFDRGRVSSSIGSNISIFKYQPIDPTERVFFFFGANDEVTVLDNIYLDIAMI